ncbi:MAG: hypothetical protein PHV18_07765 [Lachnospiraceae bacterium]|nr:hypothetical protein [Lachnospiraceae bacterium]
MDCGTWKKKFMSPDGRFFGYMEIQTKEFREKYAPQMHRTARWTIREHTLEIIEPFLR